MKMPYCRATVAAMIVVAGIAFCLPARASTFSVGGSGHTFTVTRSGAGTNAAETMHYRAVGRGKNRWKNPKGFPPSR